MRKTEMDLLTEHIRSGPKLGEVDNGASSGSVQVAFRNVEKFITNEIRKHDTVFGCVAWLTNREILAALASRWDTSIIVQKEDFLRPDKGGPHDQELRNWYAQLPNKRGELEGVFQFGYNSHGKYETDSVRCVGYATDKGRTTPRMHNKFLVLCDTITHPDDGSGYRHRHCEPRAVITGSFNMTVNATRSLENVVLIEDETIASAYYEEFVTIYGISESLDWSQPYVDPHYNDGGIPDAS